MSKAISTSPADKGFRMPAEWEPHERCWMMWPSREGFWDDIRKSSNYYVGFVVGGDYSLLLVNNATVNVFAGSPVEEGLDTEVTWNVSITWKESNNPKSSNVPVGIFN